MPAAKKRIDLTEEMNQILEDTARVKGETDELLIAINEKSLPVAALKAIADNLRDRMAAIDHRNERIKNLSLGHAIAFRQRTGRDPIEGKDEITGADIEHGERIAAGLLAPLPKDGIQN